jgi:hypothetical protein
MLSETAETLSALMTEDALIVFVENTKDPSTIRFSKTLFLTIARTPFQSPAIMHRTFTMCPLRPLTAWKCAYTRYPIMRLVPAATT